eukprot:655292-Hanusia_phi.AAC.3
MEPLHLTTTAEAGGGGVRLCDPHGQPSQWRHLGDVRRGALGDLAFLRRLTVAQVVIGLGETLVGNFPGRALGFSMKKDGSGDPIVRPKSFLPPTCLTSLQVHSLPSKSIGLFGGGLIFRSDSNGEDLPVRAGGWRRGH